MLAHILRHPAKGLIDVCRQVGADAVQASPMLVAGFDGCQGRVRGLEARADSVRAAADEPLQGVDPGLASEGGTLASKFNHEREIALLRDGDGVESRHGLIGM